MNFTKIFSMMLCAAITVSVTGCREIGNDINAISREGSSGTRSAFTEIIGITDENGVDHTTPRAEEIQSTGVVMTGVAGNVNAIGYVSLGTLSDIVKPVRVDGVLPTAENIKNGEYKIFRSFNMVHGGELSPAARDFIKYIFSAEGQSIVEDTGYIRALDTDESYSPTGVSGKIIIDGSTSVYPLMEKLSDKYREQNPQVTVEIQQTGSSAGISSVLSGVCDIGMASRELKESELKKGAVSETVAYDGIAVIVNKENPINGLTSDMLRRIYTGEVTEWSEVSKELQGVIS